MRARRTGATHHAADNTTAQINGTRVLAIRASVAAKVTGTIKSPKRTVFFTYPVGRFILPLHSLSLQAFLSHRTGSSMQRSNPMDWHCGRCLSGPWGRAALSSFSLSGREGSPRAGSACRAARPATAHDLPKVFRYRSATEPQRSRNRGKTTPTGLVYTRRFHSTLRHFVAVRGCRRPHQFPPTFRYSSHSGATVSPRYIESNYSPRARPLPSGRSTFAAEGE